MRISAIVVVRHFAAVMKSRTKSVRSAAPKLQTYEAPPAQAAGDFVPTDKWQEIPTDQVVKIVTRGATGPKSEMNRNREDHLDIKQKAKSSQLMVLGDPENEGADCRLRVARLAWSRSPPSVTAKMPIRHRRKRSHQTR